MKFAASVLTFRTISPIRVTHEFLLRIFYSIEGETVAGRPIKGPGEVRMCQVRLPVTVPSCLCSTATLNLPTCELRLLSYVTALTNRRVRPRCEEGREGHGPN